MNIALFGIWDQALTPEERFHSVRANISLGNQLESAAYMSGLEVPSERTERLPPQCTLGSAEGLLCQFVEFS